MYQQTFISCGSPLVRDRRTLVDSEWGKEETGRENGLRLELATGQANSRSLTTLTTILALDGIALLFFIRNTHTTEKEQKSEDSSSEN